MQREGAGHVPLLFLSLWMFWWPCRQMAGACTHEKKPTCVGFFTGGTTLKTAQHSKNRSRAFDGRTGSRDRASVMAAQPAIGLQACGCALAVTFVFRPCGQDVGQVHTVFTPCAYLTRGLQHGLTVRMQAGACKSERVCKRPRLVGCCGPPWCQRRCGATVMKRKLRCLQGARDNKKPARGGFQSG